MQKLGQNLLAKTCRSTYSYLNNKTVVANNRESELNHLNVMIIPFR